MRTVVHTRTEEIIIPELEESQPSTRFWTPYEEEVLKKYYGKADPKKIAETLGRTKTAIQNKAQNMGLRYGGE